MNPLLEAVIVAVIVAACLIIALRSLLPFGARVWIARRLQRCVPDRVVVWVAGQDGCDNCGGGSPRTRGPRHPA